MCTPNRTIALGRRAMCWLCLMLVCHTSSTHSTVCTSGVSHQHLQMSSAFVCTPIPRFSFSRPRPALGSRMQTRSATPEQGQKERLARMIKDDLVDLDRRLMAAPYEIGAQVPSSATCFSLQELRADGGHGAVSKQLCEEMRENHFAIVRLDDAGESALQGVWTAARRFFDLSGDQKEEVAGRMRKAVGNVGVIGWGTMPDDNEFLEMRVAHGGKTVPQGLDDAIPGFTAATNAARHELFGLSRAVMSAAEGYLGMSGGALESLLDDGTRLSDGQWSSTQHRLCLYHADTNVPFEAHTDTTFLTLIPCSSIAGLEVWTEKNGWVRPEEHKESGGSVVVMPGEFLQVFTAGFFSAAVHRVTRFSSTALASEGKRVTRLSAPLLVRGVKETVIDPSAFLDANEAADKRIRKVGDVMKRLEGVTLYDLHSCLVQPPNLDSL